MKHFEWSSRSASSAKTIAKEVFLPLAGILGITALLVAILYACIEFGKGLTPVIPVHVDDGETVDPNPLRFAFMLIGFALSFVLAAISEHKGRQGRTFPAFWWGYAGGTLLWQSVGECAWHFSIRNEDYLMCFPHIEGASAIFMVLVVTIFLIYCYERKAFGWGVWVFVLSFVGNWFGHFIQIGSYPIVSSLMEERAWFQLTGAVIGSLTCLAAILLGVFSARDTKARLCTSLMLYFGLGIIVTGVAGL
jgi:hypothetical protein